MRILPSAAFDALPDRARELISNVCLKSSLESGAFPGEFEVEEVRAIAARTLGVDLQQLLSLITNSAINPQGELSYDFFEIGDELLSSLSENCETPAQKFVLRLTTGFSAKEVLESTQRLRSVSNQYGISWQVVGKHFAQILVYEHSRIGMELVLFESNLAISEGFVEKGNLDQIRGSIENLWNDPDYRVYLDEKYPLFGHHLRRRTKLIAEMLERFVVRLAEDLPDIKILANTVQDAELVALKGSLGDSHNGGARVSIVEFSDGNRVVYKPRGVAGEAAFQRYLKWINSRSTASNYRCLWVIERSDYGWMEYVSHEELRNADEADTYFSRYGGLIAIINSIAGTDIHYENLIAVGDQPVVIDLETIIHPLEYAPAEANNLSKRYLLNLDYFVHTPLFTGMFDPAFLDRSLNGSPLSDISTDATTIVDFTMDADSCLVAIHTPLLLDTTHQPRYSGKVISFTEHIETIVRGYREMAAFIGKNRRELLNNVLDDIFGRLSVRVIFRYTAHYASYGSALYSPYAMQSIQNSEELLSKLWRITLNSPASALAVSSEYRDLWNGDIPFFSTVVNDTTIKDSKGTIISGVLKTSGMNALRERMIRAGISTIDSDADLLEYCLRQKARDVAISHEGTLGSGDTVSLPKTWQGLELVMVDRILVNEAQALYMDTVMTREMTTSQSLLGDDFYTGLPGVVFSLAYCDTHSIHHEWQEKIRALADIAFLRADNLPSEVGVCKGIGGLIYLAAHLGAIWSDPYYWDVGVHLAKCVANVLYTDRHFDIFSGASGALLAIDALASVAPSCYLDNIIEQLVSHLIRYSNEWNGQVTWMSSIPSNGSTTGFAHGVSGIAYALLRAYRRSKSDEIKSAIIGAERFIDHCFSSETGTWLECREDIQPQSMEVWCHGAPGIGLFYDELARQFPEQTYRRKADIALRNCIKFARFENDSICHGTLGNIDLLISHRQRNPVDAERLNIGDTLNSICSELQTRDLSCGNERKHLSLSFFNGLSGCAYQLLRLEHGRTVPSVTVFDGPITYGD